MSLAADRKWSKTILTRLSVVMLREAFDRLKELPLGLRQKCEEAVREGFESLARSMEPHLRDWFDASAALNEAVAANAMAAHKILVADASDGIDTGARLLGRIEDGVSRATEEWNLACDEINAAELRKTA
jgi:hypothetical protein